jgi:hypothetical protein
MYEKWTPAQKRFFVAQKILEFSFLESFHGSTQDSFFKLSPKVRAAMVLKLRAKFSLKRISLLLQTSENQIEKMLEQARFTFSDGRSWFKDTKIESAEKEWKPICQEWEGTVPRSQSEKKEIQQVFTKYLGEDLDSKEQQDLHIHLQNCEYCFNQFQEFKRNYFNWAQSLPQVMMDYKTKEQMEALFWNARVLQNPSLKKPSILGSFQSFMRDPILLLSLFLISFLIWINK